MFYPGGNEETFGLEFLDSAFKDCLFHLELTPVHRNDVVAVFGCYSLNSLILTSKSPFFYKLFKKSKKILTFKNVSLRISVSEEKSFMDMLKFMYTNTLTAATNPDLFKVLILADKFEVSCCMKYCVELLLKNPLSVESAVSFLELPSNVLKAEAAQPLIDAANHYLFEHFREFNNSLEEAMKLPLSALGFVLGRGDLQVVSEDDVFDFVLKWAHAHYPIPEERQEIISNWLIQFISFPYMTYSKLKKALVCPEFDEEVVSKFVIEALFYKAQIFSEEHVHDSTKDSIVGHLYHDRLVKAAQLELSRPRRVIFFDLKKDECESMSSSNDLCSQPFFLGGLWFSLWVQRRKKELSLFEHFGLYLKSRKGSKTCTVKLVIEVMEKSSNKFEGLIVDNDFKVEDCQVLVWPDVFETPWTTFMSDDSKYFIDGILRFRVDITIINYQS